MEKIIAAAGKNYEILKLLGHGKGGYSYLAKCEGREVVLKQIHHEPCAYYTFGNKIEAERNDYQRLKNAGIRIPEMLALDTENERIVKEYIAGDTVFDIVRDRGNADPYLPEVREMAAREACHVFGYECNGYMDEWNFENWGIKYWSRTPEFEEYLRNHH